MHRAIMCLTAVATTAVAAPAQTAPADANIRCFLVSNMFAKAAKDAKGQQIAAFVRFYNLGQMQAKLSPAQIKAQVAVIGKSISPASAADIMNSCAGDLEGADKAIEAIGQQLQAQARK